MSKIPPAIEDRLRKILGRVPVAFQWYTGQTQPVIQPGIVVFWENPVTNVVKIMIRVGATTTIFTASGSGHTIQENGSDLTERSNLDFEAGLVATDTGTASKIDVDYETSAGNLADAGGTAAVGVLDTLPRADHVHGKGDLTDGTVNEVVSGNWSFSGTVTLSGSGKYLNMNTNYLDFKDGYVGIFLRGHDNTFPTPNDMYHKIYHSVNNLQIVRSQYGGNIFLGDGTYSIDLAVFGDITAGSSGTDTVWTSGNDGAGSGLDADTLDGVESSAFQRARTASITSADSPYTLSTTTNDVVLVDATTANVSIKFPTASGNGVHLFFIRRIDASANTVEIWNPNSTDKIEGTNYEYGVDPTGYLLGANLAHVWISDGTDTWYLLADK